MRIHYGVVTSEARSVDLSTSGILLTRAGRSFGDSGGLRTLELALPGESASIRAVARPVWSQGPFQALKFVKMSAIDRLTLAEHMDRHAR